MLVTVFLFLVALAHVCVITAAITLRGNDPFNVVLAAMAGTALSAWASISASSVETVTETGSRIVTPHPTLGWWMFGLTLLSVTLAVLGVIAHLNEASQEITSYGV